MSSELSYQKRIAELEQQIADLRKDAERYRWLRSKPVGWYVEHERNGWTTSYGIQELDVAIDAALTKAGEKL
jgi:hypothetical protein